MSTSTKSMDLVGDSASENFRPTPENTFYVSSQAELEAALGSNLIIPTSTNVAVIIDKSFSLTKPFLKQAASSLFLYSSSSNVSLTYTGTGAMIQMDGAVIGDRTQFYNLNLIGNFTNNLLAVEDSGFFTTLDCTIQTFAKVGFLKGTVVIWRSSAFFACLAGVDFINCPTVTYRDGGGSAFGVSPSLTAFSFITDSRMDIVFRDSQYNDTVNLSNLLFIDPNMPIDGSVSVTGSGALTTIAQQLFQQGVDEAVTAVADNGSGAIRCTSVGHGQVNNTYAVLTGFSEAYNGTALITVIDVDTFDVESVTFTLNDTGTINRSSLDSTDVRVIAENNADQRDSMFIGEAGLEIFMAPISSSSLAQGVFEEITSASWVSTNLERFEDDTVTINQGRLVALDTSTREYDISYSATIEKVAGGSVDVGIVLLVNGVDVSFNPPHTVNSGIIQISGSDLIELAQDDVIQVAVKNYDASATVIDIFQVSLVISKG